MSKKDPSQDQGQAFHEFLLWQRKKSFQAALQKKKSPAPLAGLKQSSTTTTAK
jgi:hypothetical protein